MIGKVFAHYRVQEKLGEGSMGVVYKAEHTRLHHPVALKFLRPELVDDPVRKARFLREAEIAASLDSPAVCSVIDFGEEEGELFLVMRYCDGQPLADRLLPGPLELDKALIFAIQLAEGLQAAHAHGVVHRDVKPSNIIVGLHAEDDGSRSAADPSGSDVTLDMPRVIEQIKLTDFGLAFLPGSTRLTLTEARLGTPAYMSPEQVTGREADARSDIWGLGAVLYEMVTGQPPFGSADTRAIMYAVEHADPPPVRDLRPDAPPELVWIIGKCLRKNPDKRYQQMTDLLRDLRLLRRKLNSGHPRDMGTWIVESRGRIMAAAIGALAVCVVLVGGMVLRPEPDFAAPGLGRTHQVTTDLNWEGAPAASPDGSRIAYAGDAAGNLDIYVVPARGGASLQLTSDPGEDTDPAWLPDGSGLVFESTRLGTPSIWRVGPQGGDPVLLLANGSDPAVSPDGTHLAFARTGPEEELRIHVVHLADSGTVRRLTDADHGTFAHVQPAWSPDGRLICYATADDLWVVPAVGGRPRRLTAGGTADSSPTWSPSGDDVYFSSVRENNLAIWRVPAAGGAPERLTPGSGPESSPSLAADGSLLAYSTGSEMINEDIVVAAVSTGEHLRLVGIDDAYQPCLSPDGTRVCFVSSRWQGRRELWVQELDGHGPVGSARRITEQPGNAAHPCISPDGRWLAYYRITGDRRRVWVMPLEGGTPRELATGADTDIQPTWSPGGDRLAFVSDRDRVSAVYAIGVADGAETGTAQRLTPDDMPAVLPRWSPDGTELVCVTTREGRNGLCVVAADGSGRYRRLDIDAEIHMAQWDPASGDLWVSGVWPSGNGSRIGIRRVDPADGRVHDLDPPFSFEERPIFAQFHADAAGRRVVYSLPLLSGDIWTLEAAGGAF